MINKIELLAPGGDSLSVKAAILAGANAVYLGVGKFNARQRAENISSKELKEFCAIAHQRECRIYLAFNILALEDEIQSLMQFLAQTIESGIDAVIIQDYGLLSLVHTLFPQLEIHGSTQLTTHNAGQLKFLIPIGVRTVNFSRELSHSEIKNLTALAHQESLKVEVFIHGAFCVSYSGQCYISGALYENSANRGACVQPCRREYKIAGLANSPLIRPLNLKDNSLYSSAGDLIAAGVDSLKIEGRIKGFEYVFNTVSAWREQLDRIDAKGAPHKNDPRLTAVFHRFFSDNLFKGRLGMDSFTPDKDDKSFSHVASVVEYKPESKELSISSDTALFAGQSITIRSKEGQFICIGILSERLRKKVYRFQIEHKLMGKIYQGQHIWAQPQLIDRELLISNIKAIQVMPGTESANKGKEPLNMIVTGAASEPLTVTALALGKSFTAISESPLEMAIDHPTALGTVEERLGKLGNTPFFLASCNLIGLSDNLFIPVKLLNDLRRTVVAALAPKPDSVAKAPEIPYLSPAPFPQSKRIAVVVANRKNLEQIPRHDSVLSLFQLPADPEVLAEIEFLFDDYPGLIPWFPSILVGRQFDAACEFLIRSGKKQIVTDNTGIAVIAKEYNISWIAGPLINGTNGYTLNLFRERGAIGAFCSSELSPGQFQDITIPQGLELWSPLVAPTFLLKSRHCLIRNCLDCGKSIMDEFCLAGCTRETTIMDSQKHSILVVKNRGDYNSLYRSGLCLYASRLQDSRIGTFLLDFRASHQSLLPYCSIGEFISITRQAVDGNSKILKQMEKNIPAQD